MGGAGAFFVGLFVMGLGMRALEHARPSRPHAPLVSRGRLVDVLHWLVGAHAGELLAKVAVLAALLVAAVVLRIPLASFEEHQRTRTLLGGLPLVCQVPLVLLGADLLGYGYHRLLHATRLFRLHAVHHSSRQLDFLSSARNHPVAEALGRVLTGVPLVLLGLDPRVVAPALPLIGIYGVFLHANVRVRLGLLEYLIATPHFHRWHHAHPRLGGQVNFAGLFPVWDILFGTFSLPPRAPTRFGLEGEEVPESFLGQMRYPFRRRGGDRRPKY